jgi:hypothetical protein
MPFRTRTETKTIPYPENEPRKSRQEHNNKIDYSCLSPHPSENDEHHQGGMKDEEEYIQERVHPSCL